MPHSSHPKNGIADPVDVDAVRRPKYILVAEDSEMDFMLLEKAFGYAGFHHRLHRVGDGAKAIAYLKGEAPFEDRQQWPLPDLLLVDGKMPGASGFDILKFLRGQGGHDFPVVMFSGSRFPNDTKTALSLGATEYLAKPDSPSDLIVLVQTIHHRWLGR